MSSRTFNAAKWLDGVLPLALANYRPVLERRGDRDLI